MGLTLSLSLARHRERMHLLQSTGNPNSYILLRDIGGNESKKSPNMVDCVPTPKRLVDIDFYAKLNKSLSLNIYKLYALLTIYFHR